MAVKEWEEPCSDLPLVMETRWRRWYLKYLMELEKLIKSANIWKWLEALEGLLKLCAKESL